jgi:hypothetical protein
LETNPHKELPGTLIVVLCRICNIAAAISQQSGNGMNDASSIWTGKRKNISVRHESSE